MFNKSNLSTCAHAHMCTYTLQIQNKHIHTGSNTQSLLVGVLKCYHHIVGVLPKGETMKVGAVMN